MLRVTISMREIVGGMVRHCGPGKGRENKNREIFFLACLLVIRENFYSRKFPAIRYLCVKILLCAQKISVLLTRAATIWLNFISYVM